MTQPDLSAGNCRNDVDPDMWYRTDMTAEDAADLCHGCPVRSACLAYAIENPAATRFGVWGGMTEEDRKTQRRRLRGQGVLPDLSGMQCKRRHDLTLPGAVYAVRDGEKVRTTCAQCRRDQSKARWRNGKDRRREAPRLAEQGRV